MTPDTTNNSETLQQIAIKATDQGSYICKRDKKYFMHSRLEFSGKRGHRIEVAGQGEANKTNFHTGL
jgi:hypothetical protein